MNYHDFSSLWRLYIFGACHFKGYHAISPRSPRGLRLCEVFPLCFLALGLRVLRANLGQNHGTSMDSNGWYFMDWLKGKSGKPWNLHILYFFLGLLRDYKVFDFPIICYNWIIMVWIMRFFWESLKRLSEKRILGTPPANLTGRIRINHHQSWSIWAKHWLKSRTATDLGQIEVSTIPKMWSRRALIYSIIQRLLHD